LEVWPEHRNYIEQRFRNFDPAFEERMEELARLALIDIGDELDIYCSDYRWMCEAFIQEEIYFRRNSEYRLSSFAEAYAEVYSNPQIMSRYVRGILISQLFWEPHARAFDFFRTAFLSGAPDNARYLEVGPGHGLFLYFASAIPSIASLEAWDVSQSSIAQTRRALAKLGVAREIAIVEQDVLKAPSRHGEFDCAVISEVLEHLEAPDRALQSLHAALRPGGRIFINAPVNSPAPDHIYLWRSTEEFVTFVEAQGFTLERTQFFPVTGATLDSARRKKLSISCVLIGRKQAARSPTIRKVQHVPSGNPKTHH
jgi:2-polyprenyl-3-methyl-5-hydroxy-6-metoxy-1,4-benzoquinol methylase